MIEILWDCFLVAIAGGVLSLDRTAVLQVMVSRPLIAATLIGYILGDVMAGLLIGSVLELLWIGQPPIGGYIPPHEVMLTVLIAGISIIGQKVLNEVPNVDEMVFANLGLTFSVPNTLFFLSFAMLLIIPADIICKKGDSLARSVNVYFFNAALSDIERGVIHGVYINNLKGLCVFFAISFPLLFIFSLGGVLLMYYLFPLLPKEAIMSLPLAFGSVLILSFSSAYSALYSNRSLPLFLTATFAVIIVFMAVAV